jgi:hypothetical protein
MARIPSRDGMRQLLAHAFARRLAREFQCPYYPPLFIGTECQRRPETLESIGFKRDARIEGMDFPNHSVARAHLREEVFALVVRDTSTSCWAGCDFAVFLS